MRAGERDALLERQTWAVEAQAAAAEKILAAIQRRDEEEERRLRAAFPPARRLFAGERGAVTLLQAIPGFAGLWEKAVPDSHLLVVVDRDGAPWEIVLCTCGEQVALERGNLGECPGGGCGRWFFATGDSVRVRRFELEDAA